MTNLKERTQWAIEYVAKKNDLSIAKIGKRCGIKGDTVNSYKNKLTDPKIFFVLNFCEEFDLNEIWF